MTRSKRQEAVGIEDFIRRAKAGERRAGVQLMHRFRIREHLGGGGDSLIRYFSEAFKLILDGENPEVALNIKHGVGKSRKRESEDEFRYMRDFTMAMDVAERLQQGESLTAAYTVVAEDWKCLNEGKAVSDSTVGRAYRRHKSYFT